MEQSELLYEDDSGRYWSETELWHRLESGQWEPERYEMETRKEWVRTEDGDLVELTPIDRSALPDGVDVEPVAYGVVVRDERTDA